MLSIINILSASIASGNRIQLEALHAALRCVSSIDEITGKSNIFLLKECRNNDEFGKDWERIAEEVGDLLLPIIREIPEIYLFAKPDSTIEENEIYHFRRILEESITNCFWFGKIYYA